MSRRAPNSILDKLGDNNYRRRGPGSRSVRRNEAQKERRKRTRKMVLLIWILSTGLIVGVTFLQQYLTRDSPQKTGKGAIATSTQETWLLIGTREADENLGANWLTTFAYDSKSKESFSLYLPGTALVEIPGYGQEALSKALAYGRAPLQVSTVSNVLGVGFDHYLKISDQSLRAFVETLGGLDIEVHSRLTETEEGRVKTVFAEGKQHLDGQRASEYLNYLDTTGDEISRATRHANFWNALLSKFRSDASGTFGKLLSQSKDLWETDATPAEIAKFFDRFQSAADSNTIFNTLPVKATGVDTGKQFYGVDRESTDQMVERYLRNARPAGASKPGRRVEILNGNGKPGIGEQVSGHLIPKGFRIILNQNAKRFDYETTQIVVYSNSKAAIATAEEIKRLLGLGEILISRQSQTLVDVTIVVGQDYINR